MELYEIRNDVYNKTGIMDQQIYVDIPWINSDVSHLYCTGDRPSFSILISIDRYETT